MLDCHEDTEFFNEPNWERLRAPVVPPTWVKEKVMKTRKPVYWENSATASEEFYPMYYRSEFDKFYTYGIVTRLLPSSEQPTEGWLLEYK